MYISSACNRTFYGVVGGTYTIAVHRPSARDSQLPFVCQLTFAAGGSKFGDLVQVAQFSSLRKPRYFSSHKLRILSTTVAYELYVSLQLIFNSVTLGPSEDDDDEGRHASEKSPTCRQGHITLNEPDRPATAGHWCGHDWGQAVFFSETSRVRTNFNLMQYRCLCIQN